uniref:E3 ubiquitin-protein ligase n=1 Tax=Strongyloides papillosus TaxID=174720 RepID=A0A0N5C995_STREA
MSYKFRNVDIYFEVGDILTSNVDAICVSTTAKLDLKVGAGRALRRKVGDSLDAVLAVERQKITHSTGVVVIDGGASLDNKKIIFALIRGSDVGFLYDVYERVFRKAIDEGFKSIALTAIGTGALNVPIAFGSICSFVALNRINNFGSLEKIYFKDISSRTINEYERKFRRAFGGTEGVIPDELELDEIDDGNGEENIESTAMVTLTDSDRSSLEEDDKCAICLSNFFESSEAAVKLKLCRHIYHLDCINEAFKMRPRCPLCLKTYITTFGPQPLGGSMTSTIVPDRVPGFPDANGFIEIKYKIPSGIQNEQHIRPGLPYMGVTRIAYLPNTEEGVKCLKLLEVAFKMRLIFTVSDSITTGKKNVCVWNGIHHKTSKKGDNFGYPDPGYLIRLQRELNDLGITEELL